MWTSTFGVSMLIRGTLFAVVDNSNTIAVFNDFLSQTSATLVPDAIVEIEGLVRTHGITYYAPEDLMILTDIGDANDDRDGALLSIPNFMEASADGLVDVDERGRATGGSSLLGNPVDVALDRKNERIYVAERARGGGRILAFKLPILTGGLTPVFVQDFPGASAIYFSDDMLTDEECSFFVDPGQVRLEGGDVDTTIFIDGMDDVLSFDSTAGPGGFFTYVVTDINGKILGIPSGDEVNFEPAGTGVCFVYGLSYTGNLNINVNDNLFEEELEISNECFALSDTRIMVNRVAAAMPDEFNGQLYVSSNTDPVIGVYGVLEDNTIINGVIPSVAEDGEGIFYDPKNDVLYQLNRTDNVINAYSDVSNTAVLSATSTSDFINGREIAVLEDKLVVAQDASEENGQQNRLIVYTISPTEITFDKAFDVDINLWGIDITSDGTLLAVVDNSNQVAIFDDFLNQTGDMLTTVRIIEIEGLIRTHGITYNEKMDYMLLTDIGEAGDDRDGAIVAIPNFSEVIDDELVSLEENERVFAGAAKLGDPVDIALDEDNRRIYVSERINGDGRVLGFKLPILDGGIAPVYNQLFPGASAIYFSDGAFGKDECLELTDGGEVNTIGFGMETTIFIDGEPDVIGFSADNNPDDPRAKFTFVVTDADGIILGIPLTNMIDFEPAGTGTCFVYGLSYTGRLNISEGDDLFMDGLALSTNCFDLSDNRVTVNRINCDESVDGGTVSLEDGTTETTIIIDGEADVLSFIHENTPGNPEALFTYVVTDEAGNILGIPPGNEVDFDPAGVGTCFVYGLSYTGDLNIEVGDNLLFLDGMLISSECFELSSNLIIVNRVKREAVSQFFVSSNTRQVIGEYQVFEDLSIRDGLLPTRAADGGGIFYDAQNDLLYQVNRTLNVVNLYREVSNIPIITATSTSDFINGRGMAVSGNKLVVAQDANEANGHQNRLVVYNIGDNSIALDRGYNVSIDLWGIHADGDDLYAMVDNSNQIVKYDRFFNRRGTTRPFHIRVEHLNSGRGITYDSDRDIMFLTDVGEEAYDNDGAIIVIHNFQQASADGYIGTNEQLRLSGPNSFLGNPVDLAFNSTIDRIYVAERTNGEGRVLSFVLPVINSDNAIPVYRNHFPGASAIYFSDGTFEDELIENEEQEQIFVNQPSFETGSRTTQDQIMKLYPVPASDNLNVELTSTLEQEVLIRIYAANGKLIVEQRSNLVSGNNFNEFNISNWDEGMYILTVPELNLTKRFVKVK